MFTKQRTSEAWIRLRSSHTKLHWISSLYGKCDTRELDTEPSSEFTERAAVCWQMLHEQAERLDPLICLRTLPYLFVFSYRTTAVLLPPVWEPVHASSPLHAAISGQRVERCLLTLPASDISHSQ